MAQDRGIGETFLIVVGATHASQAAAEAAAGEPLFGDFQGYYVDVSDNYRLIEVCQPQGPSAPQIADDQMVPGQWLLLTAFRTEAATKEWVDQTTMAMTDFGEPSVYLVEKLGGPYVGLGQEAHPDGSGPVLEPLEEPPICP